jgi:hypothetical protein
MSESLELSDRQLTPQRGRNSVNRSDGIELRLRRMVDFTGDYQDQMVLFARMYA